MCLLWLGCWSVPVGREGHGGHRLAESGWGRLPNQREGGRVRLVVLGHPLGWHRQSGEREHRGDVVLGWRVIGHANLLICQSGRGRSTTPASRSKACPAPSTVASAPGLPISC